MALLPWKRLKHRLFGVNHQGVFSVDPKSGKVCFGCFCRDKCKSVVSLFSQDLISASVL